MTDPFAPFVTDPANAAALTAARTVADAGPRVVYGPLVIGGSRGAGKSHLLRAIRDRAAAGDPPRRVELVSLGSLAEQLHSRGPGGSQLRDRLLEADLVLIDDFELAGRHAAVQGFVFDVIESRLLKGRDLVIASEVSPDDLDRLDGRLLRRIRSGTTVVLGLPSPEARAAILRGRVEDGAVPLAPGVTEALARLELGSIREYLGALNRIVAFQEASPEPLGPAEALALVGLEADSTGAAGSPRVALASPTDRSTDSEFDSFLSEVAANVALQLDRRRGRLREAIAHWQPQGIRTRRLEQALTAEPSGDPEPLIAEFGRDAAELLRLAAEARALAPDLAGAELFRDPDQLEQVRASLAEARGRRAPLSAPLADLRLEALGIGSSNRLALEAAHAVVAEPGVRYNPLVLVGPSGVGKTHLLHGIGNALIERGGGPVVCQSAHSFLGEVARHRTAEELALWRGRYQWVAAFLLDDVHLLAGEPKAQAELLQIFAALAEGNRSLVFASGRRLSELEGFDPRLLTRLAAGLVVELGPPDRDVRLAVVKALLAATPARADAALIDYLAARPADSVRGVQGVVQRVLGEAASQRVIPSHAFAREVLEAVDRRATTKAKRSSGPSSGILSPGLGIVRSREKMIQVWPSAADLLMTELR